MNLNIHLIFSTLIIFLLLNSETIHVSAKTTYSTLAYRKSNKYQNQVVYKDGNISLSKTLENIENEKKHEKSSGYSNPAGSHKAVNQGPVQHQHNSHPLQHHQNSSPQQSSKPLAQKYYPAKN
jgi:hypothetical protein